MLILANTELYKEKEALYYHVRNKEGRIITDELLKQIPSVDAHSPYKKEWDLRAENLGRLLKYLYKKFGSTRQTNILDVGCGNGWMTNKLHEAGYTVTGIDLNMEELQQAERVFGSSGTLSWAYANVMKDALPTKPYDVVLFGASCQYFSNIAGLTQRLLSILNIGGEIHLIDSVFYPSAEREQAAQRSNDYYTGLGVPQMAAYYHHHSIEDLKKTGYTKVYPTLFSKSSPLQWWKYVNT